MKELNIERTKVKFGRSTNENFNKELSGTSGFIESNISIINYYYKPVGGMMPKTMHTSYVVEIKVNGPEIQFITRNSIYIFISDDHKIENWKKDEEERSKAEEECKKMDYAMLVP